MAAVQISNIYEPTPFNNAVRLDILKNNMFLNSDIIEIDPKLSALASQGGRIFDVPFWNPLTTGEPEYSTDTAVDGTPANTTMGNQNVLVHRATKSWTSYDLTAAVGGSTDGDPIDVIEAQVSKWWSTDISKRVSTSLHGIILDNIDNDSGDMVNDIASESIAGQSAATKISAEALIDTKATMGDQMGEFGGMIMHSVQYSALEKQNLIDFIPDSEGVVNFATYLGMRVFVDNTATTSTGTTDGTIYYTYMFGAGAFKLGFGTPKVPSEMYRNPLTGTGEGSETLFTRQHVIVQPQAFDWIPAKTVAPAYATLALAASWNRLVDRNQVKIACLRSN